MNKDHFIWPNLSPILIMLLSTKVVYYHSLVVVQKHNLLVNCNAIENFPRNLQNLGLYTKNFCFIRAEETSYHKWFTMPDHLPHLLRSEIMLNQTQIHLSPKNTNHLHPYSLSFLLLFESFHYKTILRRKKEARVWVHPKLMIRRR